MPPRITLHASASSDTSSRASSDLDQHHQSFQTNGKFPDIAVDEGEDLSDMDEASGEEVDELDESDPGEKDAQPQWETISSLAAGPVSVKNVAKKPRSKPPTTRVPGQTIVPLSRIEAILSSDAGLNGTPSKEASYLISLATEEFIRRLTRVAHSRSRLDKRSLTTYNDIADSAFYFEEYGFLQEMIPRPLSPKTALAERKRILEEQEALLHGVGVEGADSTYAGKNILVPPSTSASTSDISTPVPRLSRPTTTPSTSANGKTTSKAKKTATDTNPPVIRSERQKLKRARIASESQATGEQSASGRLAPPPSPATPAEKVNKSEDFGNGSTRAPKNSGMKIKIPSRAVSTSTTQVNFKPPILPLGPPKRTPSPPGNWQDRPSTRFIRQSSQDINSGVKGHNANGKTGNVKFAPVGVETSDQPLWTRVPLPPPPSAKVSKLASNEDSINRSQITDLDNVAEQARSSKALKARSIHEHSTSSNPLTIDHEKPPAKRARQRQRSGESTSSKGSLRDTMNGAFSNTGRTIYSQR